MSVGRPEDPMADYRSAPVSSDKMPRGIPFIVSNEAAERFSFYGMKTILVVFMTKHLMDHSGAPDLMGDEEAKGWYHLFTTAVYFFPVLGALISDAFLGKYKTILTLSVVYCLGHFALALDETRLGLSVGLTLIAIGSGGIKPCVSAHVGDQFGKQNHHLLEKVFQWFYFSINLGAFLSTLMTPLLLAEFGPSVAFGIPGLLMLIATIVFWMGRNTFVHIPAGGVGFLKETFSREGLAAIGKLMVIYAFVAMFWALFDQTGSAWVLQATKMDLSVFGIALLPSQIQAVNPILILIFIPLFGYFVYPALDKIVPMTPLRRIALGFFVTSGSFLVPALVEHWINEGGLPSIGWHVVAYVFLTAAEVMVSITALEFSYTQAPKKMKSLVMATYLLSVALGNLFTAGVNFFIQNPTPAFAPDVPGEYRIQLSASDGVTTESAITTVVVLDVEAATAAREKAADEKKAEILKKKQSGEKDPLTVSAGRFTLTAPGTATRVYGSLDEGEYEDDYTRSWELTTAPAGSALTTASLTEAHTLKPGLVPDAAGEYVLTLTAKGPSGTLASETVTVLAATEKVGPRVEASASNRDVEHLVELDGAATYDPDGDDLTYAWTFVSVPEASKLTDADIEGATFHTATSTLSGPSYYLFFAGLMFGTAILFLPVVFLYKTRTYIQEAEDAEPNAS